MFYYDVSTIQRYNNYIIIVLHWWFFACISVFYFLYTLSVVLLSSVLVVPLVHKRMCVEANQSKQKSGF